MNEIQLIEVSSDDCRNSFAKYINEAHFGGKEIIITRRGKRLAKLVGCEQDEAADTDEMHK